jgi:hypothetical protein
MTLAEEFRQITEQIQVGEEGVKEPASDASQISSDQEESEVNHNPPPALHYTALHLHLHLHLHLY